jgi:hypothetical protein
LVAISAVIIYCWSRLKGELAGGFSLTPLLPTPMFSSSPVSEPMFT